MGHTKQQVATQVYHLRLPRDLMALVQKLAHREDRPTAKQVKKLIEEALEARNGDS
jgi:predicted DNA-binding protein